MSQLDETTFEAAVAKCTKCAFRAFSVFAYLDRQVTVMLAQSNNDGRWTHDNAKLFDGVFRILCLGCNDMTFECLDCPRCHRAGALGDVLGSPSRLVVPSRCPECKGTEMMLTGFAPAAIRAVERQRAAPTPTAVLGEVGYHVAHIACLACNWVQAAEGCPICGGPGPLRTRPS